MCFAIPQVTVTLGELPKAARSLLLTISNFGGGGLKRVASLQARLLLPGASKGAERWAAACVQRVDAAMERAWPEAEAKQRLATLLMT